VCVVYKKTDKLHVQLVTEYHIHFRIRFLTKDTYTYDWKDILHSACDTIAGRNALTLSSRKKERRVKNRTRTGEKPGGERLDHIDALGLEFSATRTPKPPPSSVRTIPAPRP